MNKQNQINDLKKDLYNLEKSFNSTINSLEEYLKIEPVQETTDDPDLQYFLGWGGEKQKVTNRFYRKLTKKNNGK